MFRLLARQSFVKAVPRAVFHHSNDVAPSHWIHSAPVTMGLPYNAPPSYEMISRRLSSNVDPQAYFIRKRQLEARERGEFVDIHDIGDDPEDYDVLITDIRHDTLETTISEELGVPYLSKATQAKAKEVVKVAHGYIHGPKRRTIVPFVVGHGEEARWVFFVVDSGAPLTYLSIQASERLGIDDSTLVTIGGHHHMIHPAPLNSHFHDINLLGTDFCHGHRLQKWEDYPKRRADLYFGGLWHVEKSKL